jgi:hypothetical protein
MGAVRVYRVGVASGARLGLLRSRYGHTSRKIAANDKPDWTKPLRGSFVGMIYAF